MAVCGEGAVMRRTLAWSFVLFVCPLMLLSFVVGLTVTAVVGAFRTGYGCNTFESVIGLAEFGVWDEPDEDDI
jgi:lipopolysaccharide export LptBFGC system permease protein LptF